MRFSPGWRRIPDRRRKGECPLVIGLLVRRGHLGVNVEAALRSGPSVVRTTRHVRSPPVAEDYSFLHQRLPAALAGMCSTTTGPGIQAIPSIERSGENGSAARCHAIARLLEISAAWSGWA